MSIATIIILAVIALYLLSSDSSKMDEAINAKINAILRHLPAFCIIVGTFALMVGGVFMSCWMISSGM